MSSSATTHRDPAGEFKAPLHVLAMGFFFAVSLFFVGKAFSLKILADMQGRPINTDSVLLLSLTIGVVGELFGAVYLYRRRKHGTRKKAAALLVISAMVMMLLPIQFAVLSIWVNHGAS